MAISVTDLPPKYQAQAMKQYMEQQARRGTAPSAAAVQGQPKGNKYHNTPTERVTPSGAVLHFDSQKEARRYDHLILLERAGEIRDLRLQVDFTLQEAYTDTEGRRVRAIRYKADFTYRQRDGQEETQAAAAGFDCTSWRTVVEDVKSKPTKTKTYAMKRKMLKDRFGLDITEV
ncbi:MAG: DUF1064 domain-containing protein [Oscillospiraceae bacterium]|nr:DUF1064 domain-containing protein [Oscillospiraceae bacterium]